MFLLNEIELATSSQSLTKYYAVKSTINTLLSLHNWRMCNAIAPRVNNQTQIIIFGERDTRGGAHVLL